MSKKRRKKKHDKPKKQNYRARVMELVLADTTVGFSLRKIMSLLRIHTKADKRKLVELLEKLCQENVLQQDGKKYRACTQLAYYMGRLDYVSSRFGYVVVQELEDDIWVKQENLMGALDQDMVRAVIHKPARKGRKAEGRVTEVIQRHRQEFVGKIEVGTKFAFVVADNRKMHQDIYVRPEDLLGAQTGDKVIVQIIEWPKGDKKPVGTVIEVLGPSGQHEAEMHSILAEYNLPVHFPKDISSQANRIKSEISTEEISKRRDMREVTTFTIDPEDAKDFDDALSIRLLKNGHYEIGIHIADVTHYVKPKTLLDIEAYKRATSVYLVDRTVPMLPERLSNELCSLRPDEDKLTFSAIFELDANAHIKKEWFGRTVIHSNRRFTYEQAQQNIETISGEYAKELTLLNEMALKLKAERFMCGSINFETTEVRFQLDENGKPLQIIPKERKDAHKLVEEFMLLANKRVAEFIAKKDPKCTFIYRIHDYPDIDKLNAFSAFAKKFGHHLDLQEGAIAKSLNKLIEDIEDQPEQNVLQALAIRTMAKAVYTTEQKGHFGLAFEHYSHFTSPIRRYPDMIAHRLLQHYLDGGKSVQADLYQEKCKHCSDRERIAAEAERASIKYKQVEFMTEFIGEVMEGVVSGLTEWGIYVELIQTKCEGMIRMADITDDYYAFDEQNYRIIGQKNKKMYTMGDALTVRVTAANLDRRTIDLEFA